MTYIFVGMILVFISAVLEIGGFLVDIVPDFAGYALMLYGLRQIKEHSSRFAKIMPLVAFMIAFSAFAYAVELFGILGTLGIAIGTISLVLSLFVSYHIIMGIKDVSTERKLDLEYQALYAAWGIKVLVLILVHATVLLQFVPVAVISLLFNFFAQIYFLIRFNQTRNLYNFMV